jgi:hypothetical protein
MGTLQYAGLVTKLKKNGSSRRSSRPMGIDWTAKKG